MEKFKVVFKGDERESNNKETITIESREYNVDSNGIATFLGEMDQNIFSIKDWICITKE